jgi:hypothetical protein
MINTVIIVEVDPDAVKGREQGRGEERRGEERRGSRDRSKPFRQVGDPSSGSARHEATTESPEASDPWRFRGGAFTVLCPAQCSDGHRPLTTHRWR